MKHLAPLLAMLLVGCRPPAPPVKTQAEHEKVMDRIMDISERKAGRYHYTPDKPGGIGSLLDTATGQMWLMYPATNPFGFVWVTVPNPARLPR